MNCFKCGNQVCNDARFCGRCGAEVNHDDSGGKGEPALDGENAEGKKDNNLLPNIKLWVCMAGVAVLTIVLVLVFALQNPSSPVEDFAYELKDGYAVITGYKGTDFEISIPQKIEGRPVIAIGENAFLDYDLTSIVIPEGVKEIGKEAFRSCKCLTKVELPDTLNIIGRFAFDNCEALEKIELPKSLELIRCGAFSSCDSLREIRLFAGLEIEKGYIVIGTSAIQSYVDTFPEGCTVFFKERCNLSLDMTNDLLMLSGVGYKGEPYSLVIEGKTVRGG